MDEEEFDYDLYEIKYGINLRSDDTALDAIQSEMQAEVQPKDQGNKNDKEKRKRENRARMELYDWLECIVSAILVGIMIFIFVGRVIGVQGSSMLNTLHDTDKIIMSNLFYTPKYGDIIVLKTDAFEDPLVKRVIATEGQTIDIDFSTGDVSINGLVIIEDYIRELTTDKEDFVGPVVVPPGCVFVMGDNRNASSDSRSSSVGMVDTRQILGKVLFVIMPAKNADGSIPFDRIGSVYRETVAS